MDSSDHITTAAIHELQDAVKIRHVNMELLQYLTSSLRWVLRYCRKYNIEIPEKDKITELIDRAIEIDNRTPL
jgi:hypothetical protein